VFAGPMFSTHRVTKNFIENSLGHSFFQGIPFFAGDVFKEVIKCEEPELRTFRQSKPALVQPVLKAP
jgi:hypothetical protein